MDRGGWNEGEGLCRTDWAKLGGEVSSCVSKRRALFERHPDGRVSEKLPAENR